MKNFIPSGENWAPELKEVGQGRREGKWTPELVEDLFKTAWRSAPEEGSPVPAWLKANGLGQEKIPSHLLEKRLEKAFHSYGTSMSKGDAVRLAEWFDIPEEHVYAMARKGIEEEMRKVLMGRYGHVLGQLSKAGVEWLAFARDFGIDLVPIRERVWASSDEAMRNRLGSALPVPWLAPVERESPVSATRPESLVETADMSKLHALPPKERIAGMIDNGDLDGARGYSDQHGMEQEYLAALREKTGQREQAVASTGMQNAVEEVKGTPREKVVKLVQLGRDEEALKLAEATGNKGAYQMEMHKRKMAKK